jgi:Protein of unknown function (DUF3300)
MTTRAFRSKFSFRTGQSLLAALCVLSLAPGDTEVYAQQTEQQDASQEEAAPKIPNDQLDALVAPIALYPDPLLSQVLVASTYPLEIIQLQQWLAQHKDLKGDALVAAVEKEDWDPSIQGMAALPEAVKQLAENIKWTTDLGNAFLAQQSDVMDAVQRMRAKAKDAGNLKSNEQMKVETKVVETKTVVVIEQASPEIVYVPSYNPVVVYGPPVYPYPPIAYPPPGYYAAGMAISFGIGVAMGAAWGGGWGYGAGWGGNNNITINNNNNFVNHNNRNNINGGNRNNINGGNRNNINGGNRVNNGVPGGNNKWQHNPSHRGGAPYSNRATATKYGGSARGDSISNRQANARQNQDRGGGRQQAGTMDRSGGGRQQPGVSNRASGGAENRGALNGDSRANNRAGNRGSGGGNNIGNRQVPSNGGSRSTSSFGGSSNKARAQSSSSRGASSMKSSGGGGRARSGGGRRR